MTGLSSLLLVISISMGIDSSHSNWIEAGQRFTCEDVLTQWMHIGPQELPTHVRLNSRSWLGNILNRDASPWNDSSLKVEVKIPRNKKFPDLVRYTWTFNNQVLQLVESLNAFRIEVPRNANKDLAEEFERILHSLIRVRAESSLGEAFELKIPDLRNLRSGDTFSSNPKVVLVYMHSWRDRFDGLIKEESFELYFYKMPPQQMGFRDGHGWISKPPKPKKK
jgi:hypothetical protein